jgi:hypothetical protein
MTLVLVTRALLVSALLQLAAAGGAVWLAIALSRDKSVAGWANDAVVTAIWSAVAGLAALVCVVCSRFGLRIIGILLQVAALALIIPLAAWGATMVAVAGKQGGAAGLIGIGAPALLGTLAIANTILLLSKRPDSKGNP